MKLLSIFTLSFLTAFSFAGAIEQKCTSQIEAQVHESGKLVACQTFQQKDGSSYAAALEVLNIDEDPIARVRYYQLNKGNSKYEIAFSIEEQGEDFLTLEVQNKSVYIAVVDVNNDGFKDVVYRAYRTPATAIVIHSFANDDKKIATLGMIDNGFGNAEFYPYLVADFDDIVFPQNGKIEILSPTGKKDVYVWKKKAFILKK